MYRLFDNRLSAWAMNHQQTVGLLLLLAGMIVIGVGRWLQFSGNSAPPGSDGGQWLAFGHQLFGGEQIKAGFQTYPPFVPFLTRVLSLHDGLLTLKLLGIGASLLVCVPTYLLLRTALHPWLSAILAITVALNPYHCEVLCFGGYPQLLGTAFLILSLFLLLQGMKTGQRRWFMGTAAATAVTASSNVLPTMVLAGSSAVVLLVWACKLWQKEKPVLFARYRSAFIWWIIPSIILCLPFASTYVAYFSTADRSPANPTGLTLLDITHWLSSAWLWEFILWASVSIIAFVAFGVTKGTVLRENLVLAIVAAALLIAGFSGVFILRELRFGAYIEIGLILIIGLLFSMFICTLSRPRTQQHAFIISLIVIVTIVSIIGGVGHRRFKVAYNWYDVVDTSVMPAMEWLRDNRIPGARVAATGADQGHNYGWWIEGYAHMPTYMAGDAFLFFNTDERKQVALAHRLLIEDTEPEVIEYIADTENIQFLFLDMRVLPHPPDKFTEAGFTMVFGNGTIVIMQKEAI